MDPNRNVPDQFRFRDRAIFRTLRTARCPLARYIGLLLIFVGIATTGVVLWEHNSVLTYLCGEDFSEIAQLPGSEKKFPDTARFVAVLLCLIGLLAFFAIIAHVGFPAPPPPR